MPRPEPAAGEVLVRVLAAPVTAGDARLRSGIVPRGLGLMLRLAIGWRRPRVAPGWAFAGEVAGIGAGVSAFAPSYDPLDGNHAHYTLDLSHTATAGTDALDMARRMGDGLVHLHLCDGNGASTDEHLVPGRGTQPTHEVCQMLAGSDFAGHVVLEVTTSGARSKAERDGLLAESLEFARTNLLR